MVRSIDKSHLIKEIDFKPSRANMDSGIMKKSPTGQVAEMKKMENCRLICVIWFSLHLQISAFSQPPLIARAIKIGTSFESIAALNRASVKNAVRQKPFFMQHRPNSKSSVPIQYLLSAASIWGAGIQSVAAKDGAFGLLETSWAGMLHPAGMFLLYGLTMAAGYHGLKWRRARTIGQEINELKASGGLETDVAALQKLRSGKAVNVFTGALTTELFSSTTSLLRIRTVWRCLLRFLN